GSDGRGIDADRRPAAAGPRSGSVGDRVGHAGSPDAGHGTADARSLRRAHQQRGSTPPAGHPPRDGCAPHRRRLSSNSAHPPTAADPDRRRSGDSDSSALAEGRPPETVTEAPLATHAFTSEALAAEAAIAAIAPAERCQAVAD